MCLRIRKGGNGGSGGYNVDLIWGGGIGIEGGDNIWKMLCGNRLLCAIQHFGSSVLPYAPI